MRSIVFTGGGSAGHVTPNLALMAALRRKGWTVSYIGSADGIEKGIIAETGTPFHAISSGKLRRYVDLKNLKDPFKVLKGVWDAWRVLRRSRPDVIFSKGGFVTVPVVVAGWMLRIPVIIHESDLTPGLANRLSQPFARRVCVTFPDTVTLVPHGKAVLTGLPIREELALGKADRGYSLCDFVRSKPVMLVMGGSLGAKAINDAVRARLDSLLATYQIVHICGKGHVDESLAGKRGYRQYEYISKELPDLLAMADVVVSRAGATSIFEFLSLGKPMVLIPLTRQASRGDQILNAESFERLGFSKVLYEEKLTPESLADAVKDVYDNRDGYHTRFRAHAAQRAADTILELIEQTSAAKRK